MEKPARFQKGIVANPMLVGIGVVVVLVILLVASGSLKFSGYVKVDDSKNAETQPTIQSEEPAPTPEPPKSDVKLNSESFTSTKFNFSISYPEGWKVKEQESNVNFFKPSTTKGAEQGDALVTVAAGDIGENKDMKLTTIADVHKAFLKKQFNDAEITGEKEIKVGDKDAYELDFNASIGSEKVIGRYIVIKGEKYLFAIIGMANTGFWDSEKGNIEASIQTFKIL